MHANQHRTTTILYTYIAWRRMVARTIEPIRSALVLFHWIRPNENKTTKQQSKNNNSFSLSLSHTNTHTYKQSKKHKQNKKQTTERSEKNIQTQQYKEEEEVDIGIETNSQKNRIVFVHRRRKTNRRAARSQQLLNKRSTELIKELTTPKWRQR